MVVFETCRVCGRETLISVDYVEFEPLPQNLPENTCVDCLNQSGRTWRWEQGKGLSIISIPAGELGSQIQRGEVNVRNCD